MQKIMAKSEQDREFVEYLVKQIVTHPDDVKVTRDVDEMGVLLSVKVNPEDMGLLIGRQGSTAKAIRTLARIIGLRNSARVNLRIEEPPDSDRVSGKTPDSDRVSGKTKKVEDVVGELNM